MVDTLPGVLRRAVSRTRTAFKRAGKRLTSSARHNLSIGLAVLWRRAFPRVTYIGVTGSCGKTTTTRLIGAVLATAGQCRTSAGRNGIGPIAQNVLSVDRATRFCAQEVSGSWPGRIKPQMRVLRPQIGVVTTIGSDHYKSFRSLEATAAEKGQLVELLPADGTAILNIDDPHVCSMRMRARATVMTYGRSADADIRGIEISSAWPDRLTLTVVRGREKLPLQTQLAGEQWTTSVLAAIACGLACGLELEVCGDAVSRFEPVFARSSVHPVPNGPDFILDAIKAPFWTIAQSIEFMRQARAPRKTIVFGTISDYPGAASGRYRRVARDALEVVDRVVFVGPRSGHVDRLRQGAVRDRLLTFQTVYQASAFFAGQTIEGELIYLKASLTDHLERIMLSQLDGVVCWRERCGKQIVCPDCRDYRIPHQPPFDVRVAAPQLATLRQGA